MDATRVLPMVIMMCMMINSCSDEGVDPAKDTFNPDYMAQIDPVNFVSAIDNPFLPLTVGSTFTYTGTTDETKAVMGIICTVVRDRAYLDGEIIEDTYDWFAQDKDGNVWYFGEAVDNYVNGVIDNHDGSWTAGIDGAEPGIIMLGNPVPGLHYRQEYYKGEAEDRGEVIGKNESISVAAGTFTGCLKIRETNPLEKNFLEYKYYAPGVGLIKVEVIDDPVETEELVTYDING
jgi:hypothetical protein